MAEQDPREVGDIPPDRRTEEKPEGIDPDSADTNPERQGPGPTDAPGPGDAEGEQGPSGPPPESIPGDSGDPPYRNE